MVSYYYNYQYMRGWLGITMWHVLCAHTVTSVLCAQTTVLRSLGSYRLIHTQQCWGPLGPVYCFPYTHTSVLRSPWDLKTGSVFPWYLPLASRSGRFCSISLSWSRTLWYSTLLWMAVFCLIRIISGSSTTVSFLPFIFSKSAWYLICS